MKRLAYLLVATTVLFSTGCATILKGSKESLTVNSSPSGARVVINGNLVGTTPVTAKVNGDKAQAIEVSKDGFVSKTVFIASSVGGGWVVVDVICGVVPLIVDAITGDWKTLDDNETTVVLEKK